MIQEELVDLENATQFWQQMRAFSQGIQSGRVNTAQFGVSQQLPGPLGFLEALQDHVNNTRAAEKSQWKEVQQATGNDNEQGDQTSGGDESTKMDE
jgi:hypothetical protein